MARQNDPALDAGQAAAELRAIADEIRCLPEAFDDPLDIARQGGALLYKAIRRYRRLGAFGERKYAVLRQRVKYHKQYKDHECQEWREFCTDIWGEAMRPSVLGLTGPLDVVEHVVAICGPIADLIDAEAAKGRAAGGTPVEKPAGQGRAETDVEAWLSAPELANRHGVNKEKLRKRLEHWRKRQETNYREVEFSKPREPRFLYRVSAVLPIVQALQTRPVASGETSAERPPK